MAPESDFKFGEGGHETMKNVFNAVITGFADIEEKPDEDELVGEMEEFLATLPSLYRMGIVWILRVLEVAPYAMGHRQQFSSLARDDQVQVLESFEKSSNYVQRAIILALKSIVLLVYLSRPEVERALGYDHRCLLEKRETP